MLAAPLSAAAQTTIARNADLLATSGGRPVAKLLSGTPVTTGATSSGFTEVTVEGYISSSVVAGPRDRFAISARTAGARLRTAPDTDGRILAELQEGMGLTRVATSGNWVRVRRTGWVTTGALAKPPTRPTTTAARPPGSGASSRAQTPAAGRNDSGRDSVAVRESPPPKPGDLTPRVPLVLRTAPDADTLASITLGTTLTPLARERGWVQVRIEGWVQEGDVIPADSTLRSDLSAADLRADREGTRGRLVRWDVQVLALQTADPLRRGLKPDEPYLLARGPDRENALLYLAVPAELLSTVRPIAAGAPVPVTITARVRDGRSEPVGVPILDIVSIARR
jgi:hypothetical protein